MLVLETWLSMEAPKNLIQSYSYTGSIIVPAMGISGGLWMLFDEQYIEVCCEPNFNLG